jgi:hypothetical protein
MWENQPDDALVCEKLSITRPICADHRQPDSGEFRSDDFHGDFSEYTRHHRTTVFAAACMMYAPESAFEECDVFRWCPVIPKQPELPEKILGEILRRAVVGLLSCPQQEGSLIKKLKKSSSYAGKMLPVRPSLPGLCPSSLTGRRCLT